MSTTTEQEREDELRKILGIKSGFRTQRMEELLAWKDAAVVEARDSLILELVTGYDGLREDLNMIQDGSNSLSKKAAGFVSRLSLIQGDAHKENPAKQLSAEDKVYKRLGFYPVLNDKCADCGHPYIWHKEHGWCYAQSATGHCPCSEFSLTLKEKGQQDK